jgi:hypothetical protein
MKSAACLGLAIVDPAGTIGDAGRRAEVRARLEAFGRGRVTLTEHEAARATRRTAAAQVRAALDTAPVAAAWTAANGALVIDRIANPVQALQRPADSRAPRQ